MSCYSLALELLTHHMMLLTLFAHSHSQQQEQEVLKGPKWAVKWKIICIIMFSLVHNQSPENE